MEINEIDVDKIKTNPNQPRKEFDRESLKELSSSIQSRGLINPISVKRVGDGYELICGERRLKAFKLAGIKKINAIIREYNSKEDEMAESLIENLHRTDLNSIEKENYITKLWETGKYKSKRELSRALGYSSEGIIGGYLLAKDVRGKTNAGEGISTRAIRDVSGIENIEDKKQIFKKVEKGEINSTKVREVANVINKSPKEVKQAFYSNKISIEQADKISKIKDEKTRRKMILAHKNIKNIDRSIEKNFEKLKTESKKDLIKTKEVIDNFRSNAIENQKITQRTIKSLMACVPYVYVMDYNQLKRLEHFQDLLETNLANALKLSENLKEKIKN
jgi:ParB family chromosome partitioning protein